MTAQEQLDEMFADDFDRLAEMGRTLVDLMQRDPVLPALSVALDLNALARAIIALASGRAKMLRKPAAETQEAR